MRKLIPFLLLFCFAMTGCAKMVTKQECFPGMYAEQPKSILVLPPMNETTATDAKAYYTTTIAEPLSFNGFYVFPVPVVAEIMQHEGIYDTELLYGSPVSMFKEKFGADCVLFTKIKKWDLVYYVVGGNLTVGFESELQSTTTNETLWKYSGQVVVDLGGGSGNVFVDIVATAIKAVATDYVPYARMANYQTFGTMPVGPHNARYMQDGQDQLFDQRTPAKDTAPVSDGAAAQ
ncbi:DUF799 domain-containing protein [Desulfovibrio mangrovi]|uniref:GNA1162 family protein n=1 Tax=Desulfovibrio mangrovi TaxID=2976983 RepID=UPI0022451DA3|nr:GNA1162 family protein [Desulfovibrio mangrovi]UZP65968.1 DUF799 domain-containing protein [Desulfovibrio mangrovi]